MIDPRLKHDPETNTASLEFTAVLPCELTDEEKLALAKEAAIASEYKAELEEDKSDYDKAAKKQIDAQDSIITEKLALLQKGSVNRDVTVSRHISYEEGKVYEHRNDTGELITERDIQAHERQIPIPGSHTEEQGELADVTEDDVAPALDTDGLEFGPDEEGEEAQADDTEEEEA